MDRHVFRFDDDQLEKTHADMVKALQPVDQENLK